MPLSVNLAFPYPPHGAPNPAKLGHLNSPVSVSNIDSKNPYTLKIFGTKSLVFGLKGKDSAKSLHITPPPSNNIPGHIKLTA